MSSICMHRRTYKVKGDGCYGGRGKMRFVKIMLLWAFGFFNAAFHLVHFASVIQGGR